MMQLNREGEIIMAAAAEVKIFGVPELAERTHISYTTLYNRLSRRGRFEGIKFHELRAIVKETKMSTEKLALLMGVKA